MPEQPDEPAAKTDATMGGTLLDVRNLRVRFPVRSGLLQRVTGHRAAVDGVSFRIGAGEAFGLVGESGCGKTTTGRAILRLIDAANDHDSAMLFDGADVLRIGPRSRAMRQFRRAAQIVFQDPGSSLNPRMRVERIVAEPLVIHRLPTRFASRAARRAIAGEMLERCGMPASCMDRFPHQFSGGQRQRIAIARALVLQPRLVVCDEPTSALDVSVQAQVLNLLKDLQKQMGLSLLFISHDLAVVRHMCSRIAVMRHGRIVEQGEAGAVIESPGEDYTRRLIASSPEIA